MSTAGKELEPLPESVRSLPEPREFARLLREALDGEIVRARTERGAVHAPEDTHVLARGLARADEQFGEYAAAFSAVRKVCRQELENELIDAVGDDDGLPRSGYTVPDLDGTDIKLVLDKANEHDIDREALYPAVAADVLARRDALETVQQLAVAAAVAEGDGEPLAELENYLAGLLIEAQQGLAELGKVEPQVTKVKRFGKELAGLGWDAIASTVTAAVRTTARYRGVKFSREERK